MVQSQRRFVLCLFLIAVLSACRGLPGQGNLPTRVEIASVPSATPTLTPGDLPPTWTPEAVVERGTELFRQAGPTLTPSITPTVPPRTPTPTITATPTITPTETPFPNIATIIAGLPPSTELGPSKLGVHVVQNDNPAIMEFVRRSQPAVMKAVGDLGFLQEVKEAAPRVITIGRLEIAHQSYTGSPEEAARLLVAEQLSRYLANPYVDYWEGWNEPDPNLDNMIWYSRFEQERVRLLASHGLRAAIGGFPAGVPELDEFQLFLPAIDVAIQHGGIMSLHEGAAPYVTFGFGGSLPGYPAYPDRGTLAFRYRWYYRELLEPAGLVIPLIISEFSVDGILGNRPGPSGLGWQDFQQYWVDEGWGQNGVEAYINQLAWYDAGVRQDGYVIGFTIFTAGGGERWRTYDVNGILPDLANYVIGQR